MVGARLVNPRGTITYAARDQLIGTRVPYGAALRQVLAGNSTRRVTRTATWRGARNVKALQALVPVRSEGAPRTIGALELDQNYRAVDISLSDARGRLALILAVAFLVLYLALFPILPGLGRRRQARARARRPHFSYPGATYQIEVFDPSPDEARALALGGKITPIK